MTHFLNPHFLFYMCDKCNVIISKVHSESILRKKKFHIFNIIPYKVYCNMGNKKLTMLLLIMTLHFKFIYNVEKLQL
jgi:hypothetical protein